MVLRPTTNTLECRYVIVNACLIDQWPEIFVRPLRAVFKTYSTTMNNYLIIDYSIPHGAPVND
ncbi:Hypothetical protein PHPALM_8625 [Phytophthora palmivora]|uniref:Uncharacterized protein n=1 Tax=Phytophthora palmivora TaxID=4796 RepID=A0A2P4Y9D9_9STRA|nr:Hypothetical protein PHPALM_8625 [Phytophthora palmivora]